MSKETGVAILGFLVVIIPLLGFPESWRMVFLFLIGVLLVVLGLLMRSKALANGTGESEKNDSKTFVQSDIRVSQTGSPGEQEKQENLE